MKSRSTLTAALLITTTAIVAIAALFWGLFFVFLGDTSVLYGGLGAVVCVLAIGVVVGLRRWVRR